MSRAFLGERGLDLILNKTVGGAGTFVLARSPAPFPLFSARIPAIVLLTS
jgi:hypothetical protein